MCPLWPFHYVILYVLLFFFAHFVLLTASKKLNVPNNVILNPVTMNTLKMSETKTINITILNALISSQEYIRIEIKPNKENVVMISPVFLEIWKDDYLANQTKSFNVTGDFLGSTDLSIELSGKSTFYLFIFF